jgi:carbamoyl-phosphate synthase large subunit
VCERERAAGVVVQVGGDTALRLASSLDASGVTVFGTSPSALERAVAVPAEARSATSLDRAIAVHVDAVADGRRVVIAGVMEQLEPAYVHAGDAAAILPAFTLRADVLERVESVVRSRALELGIVGLLSVHVAIAGNDVTILELAPRAGRTTAFVSRVTGVPLVRIATKVMLGTSLDDLGVSERPLPRHVAARERVFPFERLGVDTALGPEMRSTGEVIGLDDTPARAYAKALRAMGRPAVSLRPPAREPGAPRSVVVDVTERDRSAAVELARRLRAIGYDVLALGGTREALAAARIPCRELDAATEIASGRAALAIVTAEGPDEIARTRALRGAALAAHIPCFTTVALARLGCAALEEGASTSRVRPLQEWYAADT